MRKRVWLDINIGDADAYETELAAYRRLLEFFKTNSGQVTPPHPGFPPYRCHINSAPFQPWWSTSCIMCLQLGIPEADDLLGLDKEQADLLIESYNSDKSWASKGPASASMPSPLLAGRLVCELLHDEVRQCLSNKAFWYHLVTLLINCELVVHHLLMIVP